MVGRSSTQLADFLRRTAELAAIVCAFVVFKATEGNDDEAQKARLEAGANRFIGIMMCIAGIVMAVVAVASPAADKGNVIPALVIAGLGFAVNGAFWARYTSLNRTTPNVIIAVQARLYRAKTFVDACVTAALLTMLLAPGTDLATAVDLVGGVIVSAYMVFTGIKTFRDAT